ncbi:polyhomeotic-like protein 3 [Limulus polyphemus]|uniref:Polyhomeotic-like protein 3 n=1 Tax=Limulus polyphemus TaxID=6850 RepID=A0ABM1SAK1_LIMPO|nr:polyhomeotic-like protein 3 [Limulus polyphemus]
MLAVLAEKLSTDLARDTEALLLITKGKTRSVVELCHQARTNHFKNWGSYRSTQPFISLQVRPAISVATQTAVSTSVASHSHGPLQRPQVKQRPRTQVNRQPSTGGTVTQTPVPTQTANTQTQTQPTQHQKADAANQTKPTSEVRAPASTQNKSTATETKQQAAQVRPNHISVVPITTAPKTATTATNTVSTATSMSVIPTKEKKEETKMDTKQETTAPLPVPATNGNHETPPPEKKEESVKNKIQEPPPPPPEPMKEKQLQKAIVKPHVLTHVIEGYVIQEGPDPFPVSNSNFPK